MPYKIHKITKLNRQAIEYTISLSLLMAEANEPPLITFLTITQFIQHELGCLYVLESNGSSVSYAFLCNGHQDVKFKRLQYFATNKDCLNKGHGKYLLNHLLENEINIPSGCSISCSLSLEVFYNKFGFKRVDWPSETRNYKDIIMLYPSDNRRTVDNSGFLRTDFDPDPAKINANIPLYEKHFGMKINLPLL